MGVVKVTNPDKVLFPDDGFTKAEVVGYYESVAGAMIPHLEGRPLTLQRFPDGIGKSGFMQKNASKHFPDSIRRVEVPKEGGTTNHPLCDTPEDLAYLANQGTISFHVWTARQPDLEHPDRLVLDLDPPDGAPPPRDVAITAKMVMEEVGLSPGLMTTGSSGYHVVALVERDHAYDELGRLSRLLAGVVAARSPDDATTEFLKKKRGGRVFVDWLRNRWAQSVIAPWSLRPLPGAPVAMPIAWEELDDTEPGRWTLGDAPQRSSGPDPWPEPVKLKASDIIELADSMGVSADEPFDRFGRT